MEVASDTKGEVPETPGTTWESQKASQSHKGQDFPSQRKGDQTSRPKEEILSSSFILLQNMSLSPSVGKAWS